MKKLDSLPEAFKSYSEKNYGTLWQVIKAYRANLRQGTVGVKTRAMVSSTGKKPYKQKKTGSARRGSFVSPINVGGGVAHGPKARSYTESIPPKMAKVALGLAIKEKQQSGELFVDDVSFESGKTKDAYSSLKEILPKVGKIVVCLDKFDDMTARALRNIKGMSLVSPLQINAYNILCSKVVVMTAGALEILEKRLSKTK